MSDATEGYRRALKGALDTTGIPEAYDGPTWDTGEMQEEFEVEGFAAPFVVVKRKSDGAKGTLLFTHSPRTYFKFIEGSVP
jgi:hypothetical protein